PKHPSKDRAQRPGAARAPSGRERQERPAAGVARAAGSGKGAVGIVGKLTVGIGRSVTWEPPNGPLPAEREAWHADLCKSMSRCAGPLRPVWGESAAGAGGCAGADVAQ